MPLRTAAASCARTDATSDYYRINGFRMRIAIDIDSTLHQYWDQLAAIRPDLRRIDDVRAAVDRDGEAIVHPLDLHGPDHPVDVEIDAAHGHRSASRRAAASQPLDMVDVVAGA